MNITVPCSPEQLDIIEDHLLNGEELGFLPSERAWIVVQSRKQVPNCKIKSADLNMVDGTWTVSLHPSH